MGDADVLRLVTAAFGCCLRPVHFFVRYLEDLEWGDHDELLRSHTVDSIGLAELGNPGWDPICQADTVGYLYYMPAMARVLLGNGGEEYLFQFLFHLNEERGAAMTDGQREAVVRLLTHVRESRGDAIEFDRDELGVRLQQLGAQSAPQAPETSSGGEL